MRRRLCRSIGVAEVFSNHIMLWEPYFGSAWLMKVKMLPVVPYVWHQYLDLVRKEAAKGAEMQLKCYGINLHMDTSISIFVYMTSPVCKMQNTSGSGCRFLIARARGY